MGLDMENFLKDFHKKNPSCTSVSHIHGKTADGRTSYECVAEALLKNPPTQAVSVLDLACGDGILLEIILKSGHKNLNLSGIDMSTGELEVARTRLQDAPVQLLEGRAQNLPFEENSLDYIFCHMALMLMGDVEQVLSEIHRCLKPSGAFSAVIGGSFIKTSILSLFGDLLREIMKEEGCAGLGQLGDPRIRSAEGIESLFKESFKNVVVQDLEVAFKGTPSELMDFFILTYNVELLSESGKRTLHERLFKALTQQADADGILRFNFALRQVTCQK